MRRITTAVAAACALALATATGAMAQTNQSGLVNVNVADNTVQVPIAIAANICDVSVGILASNIADTGSATCDALAASGATVTPSGPGGPTRQEGLINVNLSNNTVQIPIAAAANVCDVDVFVLASAILLDDATECTARGGAAGIA
jgi:hypothetical protein